ncbi:hypothetical protein PF004_g24005 [Phytophthora fragariae]|uniref:Uncharacterized protein n=1 Tax=Phytophthora fragariae TaxID=53985 RepID=A0A6G0MWK2_9STRA|nr:hypothetical protein PF004_g24005 [Phytophthora fragariae]
MIGLERICDDSRNGSEGGFSASALKHGNLLLASGKRYPPAWPKLVMAYALAHGKLRLPSSKNRHR